VPVGGAAAGHIPFTAQAKKIMDVSQCEAQQLGHDNLAPGDVLIALLGQADGARSRVGCHRGGRVRCGRAEADRSSDRHGHDRAWSLPLMALIEIPQGGANVIPHSAPGRRAWRCWCGPRRSKAAPDQTS
jgi:hypothetical protein